MRIQRRIQSVLQIVAALLVLIAVGSVGPIVPATASAPDVPSFTLYALAGNSQQFLPLDPLTLADSPDARPIGIDEMYDRTLSEDSSTLVTIEHHRTIVVADGPTGAERHSFDSPEPVYLARLSRDGTRLVTGIPMNCGPGYCPTPIFRLYDTRDGQLLTTLTGTGLEFSGTFIDGDAHRLFATSFNHGVRGEGSWPLHITSFDLDTGNQLGSVTLSDVLFTQGPTRTIDQMTVTETYGPAMALSPNGTRFAAVDATAGELTIVDTTSLTAAATYAIHRSESLAGRAARWLGLAPQPAAAKTMDGRYLDLVFSADGRFLYLSGVEGSVDDVTGESTGRGLGVKTIDVETGEIVATTLDEHFIQEVVPAPDGQSLYVVDSEVVPWTVDHEVPYRLSRLEAQSLQSRAERTFPGQVRIELTPAGFATP
jgi:WD40 repeat protein